MASYGQVPVQEFDEARARLSPVDPESYRTFREDYEPYIQDNVLHLDYNERRTLDV